MIVSDPLSSPAPIPSSAALRGASFPGPSVAPGVEAVQVAPGIGVGAVFDPTPSITAGSLSRCRVRADRAGLNLRAGEIVVCAVYEPADLGMVVLVRCEADGHRPGALIPADEVEVIGPALEPLGVSVWDKPGQRRFP